MITFIGLAAAVVVVGAVALIFFFSGTRSKKSEDQTRASSEARYAGETNSRATGRGND